ncbi:calcium-activated potassium channel subunit beta-1 isoform X2 [Pan troglodytes]|uniref:calcium-activated potassium channel subunit beta-1 isoform X2 n=1 Tax=Pan troglodytes TaxID=9598 RepID=UPI0007DBB12B
MVKKLVMAQKRGETRALCLGVTMVVCAVITYYILVTTVLPLYQKSVWTQESKCHLIETNIRDQEELKGKKVPQYPCLWVNVSAAGRWAVLYHTEDTRDQNQQEVKPLRATTATPINLLFTPLLASSNSARQPGPPHWGLSPPGYLGRAAPHFRRMVGK